MASPDRAVAVYEELAELHHRPDQASLRDRFLVLAADAAWSAGRREEAERLRQRLLALNPHHLLKPYHSWTEALRSPDVQNYLAGLRRNYPADSAEDLLAKVRRETGARPAAPAPAPPRSEPPADSLKVYRTQPVQDEPPPRPEPKRPAPAPAWTPPNRLAGVYPLRADSAPARDRRRPEAAEPESLAGNWLSTLLFLVTLAGGLLLAAYALARPFLGMG